MDFNTVSFLSKLLKWLAGSPENISDILEILEVMALSNNYLSTFLLHLCSCWIFISLSFCLASYDAILTKSTCRILYYVAHSLLSFSWLVLWSSGGVKLSFSILQATFTDILKLLGMLFSCSCPHFFLTLSPVQFSYFGTLYPCSILKHDQSRFICFGFKLLTCLYDLVNIYGNRVIIYEYFLN